jgi:hypothetical protein
VNSKLVDEPDITVDAVCVISPAESCVLEPAARVPPVAETSRPLCVRLPDVVETTNRMLTTSPGATVGVPEKVDVVLADAVAPWQLQPVVELPVLPAVFADAGATSARRRRGRGVIASVCPCRCGERKPRPPVP